MSDGVTGTLPYDPTDYCLLASCTALALAFAIELDITIISTFPRRNGFYFWSLIICSWGCILHALGFIFKFLVGTSPLFYLCFIEIGWVAMVSGQAFVLYSRLNLVVQNQNILWGVLAAIIIDGIALHTPILIFIYGANNPSPRVQEKWVGKFNTMERIQLVGFSLQETVLGGIYIFATLKLLAAVHYERTRRAMGQLLAVNVLCIAMDAILVGLEFSSNYFAEASAKPLIYAVKLKLEYAVYRQLVSFTKATLADERDLGSQTAKSINTPADFFKNMPNILAPPPACSTPTVHTHPEQLKEADSVIERPKLTREWGSSQLELTANSIAAALTTSGGRGGKSARDLMGNPPAPADKGHEPVRPLGISDADGRSHTDEVPKEWSGIYMG